MSAFVFPSEPIPHQAPPARIYPFDRTRFSSKIPVVPALLSPARPAMQNPPAAGGKVFADPDWKTAFAEASRWLADLMAGSPKRRFADNGLSTDWNEKSWEE
jgi:hypothetical protein